MVRDMVDGWQEQECRNCGHTAWSHISRAVYVGIWSICQEVECPCREFDRVAELYVGERA